MDILDTYTYDRRQRRNTSCTLFFSLLPFFASIAIYFYLWIPESAPSLLAAAVKSAPAISLALMVLCNNGGRSLLGAAGGLLLSAGGDTCLIWSELFLQGMVSFALAHLLYSLCFLSSRYSSHSYSSSGIYILYLLLWGIGGGSYVYLLPFLQKNSPEPSVFVPAVGCYAFLIVVMATLAARTRNSWVFLGGIIFMASDLTLALQHFKAIENLEYGRHIVMTTYYLAQLLIAVGDVKATLAEEADEFRKWKRS
ncbi:lysoplasmalogenase TMEM86B-like [Hoplias malabaricus]|uniref:lysoplasmalogenase TMEM86B-like n=1 Tax=Hoplias malabaricus TaxID=27720 RepID=UPI003461C1F7